MPIMAFGTLLAYSLGAAMSWHYVAVFGACIPILLLIALGFIFDSPYWYMQQGDDKKACQVRTYSKLLPIIQKQIFRGVCYKALLHLEVLMAVIDKVYHKSNFKF